MGWPAEGRRPAKEETELVARLARGDERALGELHARFADALFRYLQTLVPDPRLAEEVLQDALVAAWRGAGGYRGDSSVKTWLFGIARRRAHETMRRRKLALVDEDKMATSADPEPGPEETLLVAARDEELAERVGRLSPHHREVLALVFFQGLSYAEAAEVTGVPVGTIKSRLHGAKRELRKVLGGQEHRDERAE